MKKNICALLLTLVIISLTGCSNSEVSDPTGTETQSDKAVSATTTIEAADTEAEYEVDIDLTQFSSTMVYSEVYAMNYSSEEYIGKSIKISGMFAIYIDEVTDVTYYACLVTDTTACCSEGLEFVLADERVFPDEYPELGSDITVAGVLETYEESGFTFCRLADAVILSE